MRMKKYDANYGVEIGSLDETAWWIMMVAEVQK